MSYGGYQDQGNPYGNPYTSASNTEAGHGRGRQEEQHELQTYQPGRYESYGQQQSYSNAPAASQAYGDYSAPAPAARDGYGAGSDFFSNRARIAQQIEQLDHDLNDMSTLQEEARQSMDPTREQQQIRELTQRFRMTAQAIRSELQTLTNEAGTDRGKQSHVNSLKESLKAKVNRMLQAESSYNEHVRREMARQYQIVNPGVSDEEARAAVADQSFESGGIFQQALQNERTSQARAVLGNVQARHNEIVRIEQTMMELVNLFQDLDTMVVQQDPVIQNAEHQTEQTNENINKGTEEVGKGIVHARRARRNKWICLGIVVLIIIIAIAIGVAVGLTQRGTTK